MRLRLRVRVRRNPNKPSVLRPLKKRCRILPAGGLGVSPRFTSLVQIGNGLIMAGPQLLKDTS